jgi:hypothetical protein
LAIVPSNQRRSTTTVQKRHITYFWAFVGSPVSEESSKARHEYEIYSLTNGATHDHDA